MAKDHRIFHRRAAQAATQVVTVEVVATVDADGNVISQETVAPAIPAIPAVPTTPAAVAAPLPSAVQEVLPSVPVVAAVASEVPVPTQVIPSVPSVPAVPPFPSDLVVPSVPAFPFPSGVPVVEAAASSAVVPSTPVPSVTPAPGSAINSQGNFTMSSTPSSASSAVSLDSISASLSASSLLSSGASSLGSMSASNSLRVMTHSNAATTTTIAGAGGAPGNPAAPAESTAAAAGAKADSNAPLETPQVVGSIVGSLAGAALILAIILLLLRRHKRRRGGALQLTGDDQTDNDQRPMNQSGRGLIPSTFLNRFSGMSRSTADTTFTGGEKSFQRVSGRKLPSAFSEGMTSEQFSRGGGTLSGSSFYTDDQGTYGGPGYAKDFGKEIGESSYNRESGPMSFRPSPARTPIIRNPDDPSFWGRGRSHLSPPQSPNADLPPRGTLGRSLPSADGSRSSRFTENV